jgi:two-component system, OmpR family, response regulator BasR
MRTSTKLKALVITSETKLAEALQDMLKRLGWQCLVAISSEAAVDCLRANHFDLIFTNYSAQQGNAFHFLCCLRRERCQVPAVVISSNADFLKWAPAVTLNIPALLRTPFSITDLKATLAHVSLP